MSGYTIAWLAWLGAFGVIEGRALLSRKPGATLSEHVWKWFAVAGDNTGWVRMRRAALLAIMAWLSVHFLTGGWV